MLPMVKKGGKYHPLKIIDISTSEEEEEVADQDIITIETSEEEEEVPDKVEKVMILYGIVLYCMLLNYTVQYCNILLCTVLYSAGGGGELLTSPPQRRRRRWRTRWRWTWWCRTRWRRWWTTPSPSTRSAHCGTGREGRGWLS